MELWRPEVHTLGRLFGRDQYKRQHNYFPVGALFAIL